MWKSLERNVHIMVLLTYETQVLFVLVLLDYVIL